MNKTKDSKPHVGIFGRRNNGKSSIINVLVGHDIAIVSDHPGTTTDPVKKSMEIPGVGPVILIDTAGIDDTGDLGVKRVKATISVIRTIDFAILVIAENRFGEYEINLVELFNNQSVPFIIVHNKSDVQPITEEIKLKINEVTSAKVLDFSVAERSNPDPIISLMKMMIPESAYKSHSLLGDFLSYGDLVLLITPIDIEAPEGRLILPQVQVLRDLLDNDCIAVVVKEREVDTIIKKISPRPKLVITDSQVFLKADASIPADIPLTSFSILLARQKGEFDACIKGTPVIGKLKDGDRIMILESCTHHVSCDDIGRAKIPRWLSSFTGKKLNFDVVTGLSEPTHPIGSYSLVIQCGGCVLTKKQVSGRLRPAIEAGVPVTNYGMAIAWVHGIFHRAVAPFIRISTADADHYL